MTTSRKDLEPVRDKLAARLAREPGFDSIGITIRDGEWALSVFLTEQGYDTAQVPESFNGYPVVKRKATRFIRS
jgi:hypothetical protein